ncbi:MAG: DUF4932 domain-containing protein [Kofleriaceae bacterium]
MRAALLVLVACSKPGVPVPAVHVDERVETLAILQRLAHGHEYAQAVTNPYLRDVDQHFAGAESDQAVLTTKRLRDHGLRFEQPMELAIRLDAPVAPNERWSEVDLGLYVAQIRDFQKEHDVAGFLRAHATYLQRVEAAFATKLAANNPLPYFRDLLGPSDVTFTVVPALLQGPQSYGVHTDRAFYQLIGLDPVDADGIPTTIDDALIVHEMAHSFVNPAVAAAAGELEPIAAPLFELVRAEMGQQNYGAVRIFLDESIVRAITVHYVRLARGDAAAARAIHDEEAHGFRWTAPLEAALAPGTHAMVERLPALGRALSTSRSR